MAGARVSRCSRGGGTRLPCGDGRFTRRIRRGQGENQNGADEERRGFRTRRFQTGSECRSGEACALSDETAGLQLCSGNSRILVPSGLERGGKCMDHQFAGYGLEAGALLSAPYERRKFRFVGLHARTGSDFRKRLLEVGRMGAYRLYLGFAEKRNPVLPERKACPDPDGEGCIQSGNKTDPSRGIFRSGRRDGVRQWRI